MPGPADINRAKPERREIMRRFTKQWLILMAVPAHGQPPASTRSIANCVESLLGGTYSYPNGIDNYINNVLSVLSRKGLVIKERRGNLSIWYERTERGDVEAK